MKLSDESASGYKPVVPVGTAGAENRVHEAALRKLTREGVNFSVPGTSIEKENEILATKRFI